MHDCSWNLQTVKFTKSEKSQVADPILLCADWRRVMNYNYVSICRLVISQVTESSLAIMMQRIQSDKRIVTCHMSHLTISFHSKHIGTNDVLKIWLSHLYGLTYFYIQHWTRIMATIIVWLTRCKFLIQIYIQVVPGSGVGCEQHQVQMIKVVTETQCSGGDGDIMKLLYWLLALPPSYIQSNQSVHY